MATYGSAAGVEAIVPAIGTLSGSTTPTTTQVGLWLAEGYAIINRALGNAGYSAPVTTGATVAITDELSALNNLYAAAYVLRARAVDTASGDGEERSEVWLKDFWVRLSDMIASNLTLVGVTLLASTTATRRRLSTLQMRKVDGYSAQNQGQGETYSYPSE